MHPNSALLGPSPHHHGPAQALPLVIQLHGISKEEVEGQQELQQGCSEEGGCRGRHIADKGDERQTLVVRQAKVRALAQPLAQGSAFRDRGGELPTVPQMPGSEPRHGAVAHTRAAPCDPGHGSASGPYSSSLPRTPSGSPSFPRVCSSHPLRLPPTAAHLTPHPPKQALRWNPPNSDGAQPGNQTEAVSKAVH